MLPHPAKNASFTPSPRAGDAYIICSTLFLILILAAIALNFADIWRYMFTTNDTPAARLHIMSSKDRGYPRPI